MSLCILGGAGVVRLAVAAFTLSWVHSFEKTRWEEDWSVGSTGLHLLEARIESMGAGMEMPGNARFDGEWWRWQPNVPTLPQVLLRRSDAIPEGWRLCADGACRRIADETETADIVTLNVCP
jgi:hypothetical protein